jgi:hypothetical protein
MTGNALTGEQTQARPADTIPVEAKESAPITTAAATNAAAEQAAAATETPTVSTPAAETPPEPVEPKVKKIDAFAERKIADEAFQRREAERHRKAAEAEAAQLRAELDALKRGAGGQDPVTPPTGQPTLVNPADFESAVSREAERRAAAAQFNAGCNKAHEDGKKTYPDFEDALKNLAILGALSEQNLQLVLETDDAPRLLYELGSDPDEAAKVFSLPPAKLAIELGKRAAAVKPQAKAAAVSKAPAPIKPLEGSAKISAEPRDEDDDATYFAKRNEQIRARRRA